MDTDWEIPERIEDSVSNEEKGQRNGYLQKNVANDVLNDAVIEALCRKILDGGELGIGRKSLADFLDESYVAQINNFLFLAVEFLHEVDYSTHCSSIIWLVEGIKIEVIEEHEQQFDICEANTL